MRFGARTVRRATMTRWLLPLLVACGAPSTPSDTSTRDDTESSARATPSEPAARFDARALGAAVQTVRDLEAAHEIERVGVVVLDPRDGRILATTGSGTHGVDDPYRNAPTGSTFKLVSIAAALDAGLDPERSFDGTAYPDLEDAHPLPTIDARGVLVHSSNVGAARVFDAIGPEALARSAPAFGFRRAWEVHGRVTDVPTFPSRLTTDDEGHRVAGGLGLQASLLHVALAMGAVANGGILHAPTEDGSGEATRVLSEEAARRTLGFLEDAVAEGTGSRAAVEGLRVAGKTGTGTLDDPRRWVAHFVGAFPAEAPTHVVAIRAVSAEAGAYGGALAAPAFAELVARLR